MIKTALVNTDQATSLAQQEADFSSEGAPPPVPVVTQEFAPGDSGAPPKMPARTVYTLLPYGPTPLQGRAFWPRSKTI